MVHSQPSLGYDIESFKMDQHAPKIIILKCGLHTHTHKHTLSLRGTHKGLILSKLQLFCLFVCCCCFLLFFNQVRDSYRIFCLGAGNDTCANETLMSMYGASCLTLLFLTYIARSSILSTSESFFFCLAENYFRSFCNALGSSLH